MSDIAERVKKIVVEHLGVEAGDPRTVLANPQHERTQAFLSKVL